MLGDNEVHCDGVEDDDTGGDGGDDEDDGGDEDGGDGDRAADGVCVGSDGGEMEKLENGSLADGAAGLILKSIATLISFLKYLPSET